MVGLSSSARRLPVIKVFRALRSPEVPIFQDSPQLTRGNDLVQRPVNPREEILIPLANGYPVLQPPHGRARHLQLGKGGDVVKSDDVIHQNAIQPAVYQILVRVDLPVVAQHPDVPSGLEDALGQAAFQGTQCLRLAVVERVNGVVVRADRQLFERDVVRPAEEHNLRSVRRDLESGDNHVVVPPIEPGDEAVPLVLDKLHGYPENAADRIGNIHLESDDAARLARILELERSTPFSVATPGKRLRSGCLRVVAETQHQSARKNRLERSS